MTNKREAKRSYWDTHVKAWRRSDETQRGYCHRHDLKLHQLVYWIGVCEAKPLTATKPTTNGFAAVHVANSHPQGLTIRLPNGLCLEGVHTGNLAETREIIGWWV